MNKRTTESANHTSDADTLHSGTGLAVPAEDITVRPMTEADLDAVAAIEKENFSRPWSRQSFAAFIRREDAVFLTAVMHKPEGETIAGYIGFYGIPNEGDITNVSVSGSYRRMGIGRRLVQALIRETHSRGITRIFLEVRKSNEAAIRLYTSEGFRKAGMRPNYYEEPEEDAVIMLRDEEEQGNVYTGI